MKKLLSACIIFLGAVLLSAQTYTEKTKLLQNNGPWEFLELKSAELKKTQIVAENTGTGKREILFESHGSENWNYTSLAYSNKSETLYFSYNTNSEKINNADIYYDFGLYAWTMENDTFSSKNQKRYAILPDWAMENACRYFMSEKDYEGLQDYLFYFCDSGDKTFADVTENNITEGPEAVKKLCESNAVFNGTVNLLTEHCFKNENGKRTEKTAFTLSGKPELIKTFPADGIFSANLLMTSTGLWYFEQVSASYPEKQSDGSYITKYKTAYQKPFLLEDSDGKFYGFTPEYLSDCKISADEIDGTENIRQSEDALFLRTTDNKWYKIYKNSAAVFQTFEEAVKVSEPLSSEIKISSVFLIYLLILAVVIIAILIILLILINTKKYEKHLNIKDKQKIFEIQDQERSKISREIHDTVVQNIRAIRLEAEILKINESSEPARQKIIEELTEVITLLRSLCYNLAPAELSTYQNGDEGPNLISILDTLSKQFSSKTKIPCQFRLDKNFLCPKLNAEKCTHIVRIVQEAFNNIEKHSYATKVSVFMKNSGNCFEIYIIDDGIGCDIEKLEKSKLHFGIRNMMERSKLIGAELKFFSSQNEGLNLQLKIPCENEK